MTEIMHGVAGEGAGEEPGRRNVIKIYGIKVLIKHGAGLLSTVMSSGEETPQTK